MALVIEKENLLVPEAELRTALEEYKQALAAHASTVGVPAPWPKYDVIFAIMANGGDFVVESPHKKMLQRNGAEYSRKHIPNRESLFRRTR